MWKSLLGVCIDQWGLRTAALVQKDKQVPTAESQLHDSKLPEASGLLLELTVCSIRKVRPQEL